MPGTTLEASISDFSAGNDEIAAASAVADATAAPYTAAEAGSTAHPPAGTEGGGSTEASPEAPASEAQASADAEPVAGDETPAVAVPGDSGPAESLEALLAAHPTLAAAVQENAELVGALQGLLAGRGELAAFQQVFATAAEAKQAAGSAQFLAGVDRLYFSDDPAAPGQFLQQLYDSQFLRDPDSGEMIQDAAGEPVSSGAYGRIMGAYRELLFGSLQEQAEAHGDTELGRAVQLIQDRVRGQPIRPGRADADSAGARDGGKETAAPPTGAGALPREIQQRLERLEALERQMAADTQRAAAARHSQSQQEVAALAHSVEAAIHADIDQALAAAALPSYVKAKVAGDIFSALNHQAGADAAFQARMDALLRLAAAPGGADAARARVVAAARAHAKPRLGAVARRILSEAGAGLRQQQEATAAKIAAQRRQTEVKSGGAAPPPARRSGFGQVQQLEQTLGRRLSDREILDL